MKKSRLDEIPYIKIAAIGAVIVLLIVVGFLLLKMWEDGRGIFPQGEVGSETVEHEGVEYVLKKNVETFLVLGLDKYEGQSSADSYNNDKQADFLMLFVLDNDSKKYTAIHINRDTMVDINVLGVAGNKITTVHKQIAMAHTYGNGRDVSCRNVAESVSSLLKGMKINHYASLTLDSVAVLNDMVGGVEVVVRDDFTGIDDTLVKGERVILRGSQALTYIRSRQGLEDSSNSARMERQQQYINALYDSFKRSAESDAEFTVNAVVKMSEYMITDRSVTQMQALAEKLRGYEFSGIERIEGKSEMGAMYMEFRADAEAVEKLIIKLFYVPKD